MRIDVEDHDGGASARDINFDNERPDVRVYGPDTDDGVADNCRRNRHRHRGVRQLPDAEREAVRDRADVR